jgi:AhpD family alkylhydroperoxidase
MSINTPTIAEPRLDLATAIPDVYRAQRQLSRAAARAFLGAGLSNALLELIRIRASQLNGCAFCLDMHSKDARHAGEREDRLYLLHAWREAPQYDQTERAALALAEAVTEVAVGRVPDAVWEQSAAVLDAPQLAAVIAVTVAICGWNRIAIATRMTPGEYQPT